MEANKLGSLWKIKVAVGGASVSLASVERVAIHIDWKT